uniref:Uncharacterized protein n=1 Tax=Arundo donax TaxID=35708 RepID=A0A0A8ZXE9_ARUDO
MISSDIRNQYLYKNNNAVYLPTRSSLCPVASWKNTFTLNRVLSRSLAGCSLVRFPSAT